MKIDPLKSLLVLLVFAGVGAFGFALSQTQGAAGSAATAEKPRAAAPVLQTDSAALLAPHKALYSFRMVSAESSSPVTGLRGRMMYAQDEDCDAVSTVHRFTAEYHYPERPPALNSSQYVSWEKKDGTAFHFNSERRENGTLVEEIHGAAAIEAGAAGKVSYARPQEIFFGLPAGAYFPARHTAEIIRRAKAGDKMFDAVIFDGTDTAGPMAANVFIVRAATAEDIAAVARPEKQDDVSVAGDAGAEEAEVTGFDATLLTPQAWHIRMAVFPLAAEDGLLPEYEMDLLLHDNGVISHVVVDYRSFTVEQRMTAITRGDAVPACGAAH